MELWHLVYVLLWLSAVLWCLINNANSKAKVDYIVHVDFLYHVKCQVMTFGSILLLVYIWPKTQGPFFRSSISNAGNVCMWIFIPYCLIHWPMIKPSRKAAWFVISINNWMCVYYSWIHFWGWDCIRVNSDASVEYMHAVVPLKNFGFK